MKKLILISLLFAAKFLYAQSSYQVKFAFEPANELLAKKYGQWLKTDSLYCSRLVSEVLLACYEQSFLMANVQETKISSDTLLVGVQTGAPFHLRQLRLGNMPAEWVNSSGFRLSGKQESPMQPAILASGLKQILQYAENNGYPFATVSLDSVEADDTGISASIFLEKNQLTFFDSIDFGGTANMKKIFLQNYANIKPGMIYQESLLKRLDARLSELPYVQVARPLGVYFYGNKAKPYVYLNSRKASSFDGVIGFAPNSSINNKLVITGDLNLKLVNLMGSGKSLELAYRGYLNNSQDLQIRFIWPYFLNSRLGIDYAFKLIKFDTSWLELFNDFGLQYRLSGNDFFKVNYQRQNIQTLSPDTQVVLSTKRLPNIHDVRSDLYGLAIRRSTLNYFLNPTKGYLLELDGAAGTKKIIPNETLQNLELNGAGGSTYSIYDSVSLSSLQYKAKINVDVFKKLVSHFVLHTQVKGGIIANPNLFINELFRIGGLKTLKGFDEQSIFASEYLIANIELRYLFQQNSGFLIFWNGAWYQNQALPNAPGDKPWGLGAGMNLETGAGVFSLYYALGAQKGNPLEIRSAKLHFGLVNYF